MELLLKNLANLLKVKTIVTIILTVVFAVLACMNKVTNEFMNVYLVVIAFYFGTQSTRAKVEGEYGIDLTDME